MDRNQRTRGLASASLKSGSMAASVKVCGCRPYDGGAAHTWAGVRKPPMEETAMGGTYGAAQLKGFDGCQVFCCTGDPTIKPGVLKVVPWAFGRNRASADRCCQRNRTAPIQLPTRWRTSYGEILVMVKPRGATTFGGSTAGSVTLGPLKARGPARLFRWL